MAFAQRLTFDTDNLKPVTAALTQSDTIVVPVALLRLLRVRIRNNGSSALTAGWDLKVDEVQVTKDSSGDPVYTVLDTVFLENDAASEAIAAGAVKSYDVDEKVVDQDADAISGAHRAILTGGCLRVSYTGVDGEDVSVSLVMTEPVLTNIA